MGVLGPLVIIDGHNLFIRNYCVNPMMDTNGARCGGTVGTIQSVRKLLRELSPSNVLLIWDGEGGSQRRKAIYKSYKEGRTVRLNKEYDFGETPEESLENLRLQRQNAADYLTLLGIPQVRADGVEADDLMAYVAGKMDHPGGCIVVTTDKDLLQLVRDAVPDHQPDCAELGKADSSATCSCPPPVSQVRVFSPIKAKVYDAKLFISEYGVLPENFRLVKALTGDKSDNIDGVKGFGDRTVARCFPFLLAGRATAGDVLEAAEKLPGVLGKRLIEQKERFLENLTLVDLSDPMLSATAARQARQALTRDLGCRELELHIRTHRDGIRIDDDKLVHPFKEFVLRRRRFLADRARVPEDDLTEEDAADAAMKAEGEE